MSINHFTSEFPSTLLWPKQQYINTMEEDSNPQNLSSKPHLTNKTFSSSSSYSWPSQFPTSWINPPYTNPPPTQNPPPNFDLNHQNDDVDQQQQQDHLQKEHLFEKPLTPSDVGKLNRLVIPKQHAERYFPLAGDSVEKGLLLSFEDELGKSWRFRYSYWNSSQSYVLTKGWSRYVKEKQLDAGDVVFFERHCNDLDRSFIGWRRRGGDGSSSGGVVGAQGCSGGAWNRGSLSYSSNSSASANVCQYGFEANVTGGVQFLPDSFHAGTNVAQDQTVSIGNPKRLRLFGVNLECQTEDHSSEPSTPEGSSISSQGQPHHQFYTQPSYSYSSNSPSNMEGITFSRDVNQTRNRRG